MCDGGRALMKYLPLGPSSSFTVTFLIEAMWLASTQTLWDNGRIIMGFLLPRVCVCVCKQRFMLHSKIRLHKKEKKRSLLAIKQADWDN